MTTWIKRTAGHYHGEENGVVVATIDRVKDHGEPTWELSALDGTILRTRPSGETRTYIEACSLAEAKQRWDYVRRTKKGA